MGAEISVKRLAIIIQIQRYSILITAQSYLHYITLHYIEIFNVA